MSPVTDIFQTLQVYLGSFYINDFNYLGPDVPGDRPGGCAVPRRRRATSRSSRPATPPGQMVPLGTVMDIKDIADADRINRYNLYPSAEINGAAAPGDQQRPGASTPWTTLAKKDLPTGYTLRVDRTGLPGKDRRQHGAADLPALRAVRVPDPLGRVRELRALIGDHSDRADVPAVRHRGRVLQRHGQQHLHADRLRRAGGHEREERGADRGIRQAAAGAQPEHDRRRRPPSKRRGCACGRS